MSLIREHYREARDLGIEIRVGLAEPERDDASRDA